jgi:hypothetical protein
MSRTPQTVSIEQDMMTGWKCITLCINIWRCVLRTKHDLSGDIVRPIGDAGLVPDCTEAPCRIALVSHEQINPMLQGTPPPTKKNKKTKKGLRELPQQRGSP